MTSPERIWTASTNGKCHVGFDAPSLNYTNEYVRADLAAVQPAHVHPDPRDEVIARLVDALNDVMEMTEPPDRNCSCHLCAPCNDCFENAGNRDARKWARAALAAAKAVLP